MTLEELVRLMGPGFHPDTDPWDYVTYPPGVTPQIIHDVLEQAWKDDYEGTEDAVYVRVLDALDSEG